MKKKKKVIVNTRKLFLKDNEGNLFNAMRELETTVVVQCAKRLGPPELAS